MAPDLATAYLAQAEEIERLRKRVEAADRLAKYVHLVSDQLDDGGVTEGMHTRMSDALAAYRATE